MLLLLSIAIFLLDHVSGQACSAFGNAGDCGSALNCAWDGTSCICGSAIELDLVIVVDSSGSIGEGNFALARTFTQDIIRLLGPQGRVGVINFAGGGCLIDINGDSYQCTCNTNGMVNDWCAKYYAYWCRSTLELWCPADRLAIRTEYQLQDTQYDPGTGWNNVINVVNSMPYQRGQTYTVLAMKFATEMLINQGRPNALKKIFLLTDGIPTSDIYIVDPCAYPNAANWTVGTDLAGIDLTIIQLGAFTITQIECLLTRNAQSQITNVIEINNFNQTQLDQTVQDLSAAACPTNENIAITEVHPAGNAGDNVVPVNDVNYRYIELYNRGSNIDFATTSIVTTGLLAGTLSSALPDLNGVIWRAGQYLVLYQAEPGSAPPFCRLCTCNYLTTPAGGQLHNRGCSNAIYVDVSSFSYNPSPGNAMQNWQVGVELSTGNVLDEVSFQGGWTTAYTGFSYERLTSSYLEDKSLSSSVGFWQLSCMAYGTPGDQPQSCVVNYVTPGPTDNPTSSPIPVPTTDPTELPTSRPTTTPTARPTADPTGSPTPKPTGNPFVITAFPTGSPVPAPTGDPTTTRPSSSPSVTPTKNPTVTPTYRPSDNPSTTPTDQPTKSPVSSCVGCGTGIVPDTCPSGGATGVSPSGATVVCCSSGYYTLSNQPGICYQFPTMPDPANCVIRIEPYSSAVSGSNISLANTKELGVATWTPPAGGIDASLRYYLYSGVGQTFQTEDFQSLTPSALVETKSALSNPDRVPWFVEARRTDSNSGQVLRSNIINCSVVTPAPTVTIVAPPTSAYPAIPCIDAVALGSTGLVTVSWGVTSDSRARSVVLYYTGATSTYALTPASRTINYPGFDISTALIQLGVLIDEGGVVTTSTDPRIVKTNCTVRTRSPSVTPTYRPTFSPRVNSFSPTPKPTSAPSHVEPAIISCQCFRQGYSAYTLTYQLSGASTSATVQMDNLQNGQVVQRVPSLTSLNNTLITFGPNPLDLCQMELRYILIPGTTTYTSPGIVTCTDPQSNPTSQPTKQPSATPSGTPTGAPVTAQPTGSPTTSPTCDVVTPSCRVTINGNTATFAWMGGGIAYSGVGAASGYPQLEQSGSSGHTSLGIISNSPQDFVSSSLDGSQTFRVNILLSNPSCFGATNVYQVCTKTTNQPTVLPTSQPSVQPTARPVYAAAAVYIDSTDVFAQRGCTGAALSECRCQLGVAQCTDPPTPGATPTVYDSRTVVTVSVEESSTIERVFTVERLPTDPAYPFDVDVEYTLITTDTVTLLEQQLPAESTSGLAQPSDIDTQANGVSPLSGTVTIPAGSPNAELRFIFRIDDATTENEKVYLILTSARYRNPNAAVGSGTLGNVHFPGVVQLNLQDVVPAALIVTGGQGEMPSWIWAIIAAAVLLLASIGFMAYRRYKQSLATAARAREIDQELANLDNEDPMGLDANDVSVNPLATGVSGATYANLGDTFDAARADARNTVELAKVDVDRVQFRSDFGPVKPAGGMGAGGGGGGAAMMQEQVVVQQTYVVEQQYYVPQDRGSVVN